MYYIDVHEKQQPSYFDDGRSSGGNELTPNSTTIALFALSETIDSIDCWIQGLEKNSLECSNIILKL